MLYRKTLKLIFKNDHSGKYYVHNNVSIFHDHFHVTEFYFHNRLNINYGAAFLQ